MNFAGGENRDWGEFCESSGNVGEPCLGSRGEKGTPHF